MKWRGEPAGCTRFCRFRSKSSSSYLPSSLLEPISPSFDPSVAAVIDLRSNSLEGSEVLEVSGQEVMEYSDETAEPKLQEEHLF